jgi:hypothetical protein
MAIQTQGINPLQVDPGTALGVGNLYPPGLEVEDPRGGVFAGNTIKYVQSNTVASPTAILAGDAVRLDFSVTAAFRRHTVVQTSATLQVLEGVSLAGVISPTNSNVAQFSWFWITVKGYVANAKSLAAGVAGSALETSATAGSLTIATAAAADALVLAAGRRAFALVTPAGAPNVGDIVLGG